jgi:MoaA/NifB/PqqE/SkfB family radical SAM enzyme
VPTKHYLNVNYVCNEHCVFCASDLTNLLRSTRVKRQLTLQQIKAWIGEEPPQRGDSVLLAGGEPTLHPGLFEIVREFRTHCDDITLFTNGLRLSEESYAREAVAAGISRFEIALFGASAETHDAITRRSGSFDRTIAALNNLADSGANRDVVLRLLVARQCFHELPDIVRTVHRLVRGVDAFSINRLILSNKANDAEAMVAWHEAAQAINEAAQAILQLGYQLYFWPVPLCIFRGDIANFVAGEVQLRRSERKARSKLRYLDPVTADASLRGASGAKPAHPDVCTGCHYATACGGLEEWYLERFGTTGLGLERCGAM